MNTAIIKNEISTQTSLIIRRILYNLYLNVKTQTTKPITKL